MIVCSFVVLVHSLSSSDDSIKIGDPISKKRPAFVLSTHMVADRLTF